MVRYYCLFPDYVLPRNTQEATIFTQIITCVEQAFPGWLPGVVNTVRLINQNSSIEEWCTNFYNIISSVPSIIVLHLPETTSGLNWKVQEGMFYIHHVNPETQRITQVAVAAVPKQRERLTIDSVYATCLIANNVLCYLFGDEHVMKMMYYVAFVEIYLPRYR